MLQGSDTSRAALNRYPWYPGYQTNYKENKDKYQPSGEGGARSPPATPHRLQNPKWPPGGPKMADGVWKGVNLGFWAF